MSVTTTRLFTGAVTDIASPVGTTFEVGSTMTPNGSMVANTRLTGLRIANPGVYSRTGRSAHVWDGSTLVATLSIPALLANGFNEFGLVTAIPLQQGHVYTVSYNIGTGADYSYANTLPQTAVGIVLASTAPAAVGSKPAADAGAVFWGVAAIVASGVPAPGQPTVAPFATSIVDSGALDTGATDPIDGTALRTGSPRQAVDLRQAVSLLDWGN